ncbi:6-phosphogluconolactonase [Desulfomicrobium escambiense]|uniref:6-phosphogluconolactonase n=1 Tax=Desulfomicrobium escambiense TaxID=29503 RepID=UPI0003F575DF|nr:6-phosphogluconolactonase [Desulfomicrobium escambiense]
MASVATVITDTNQNELLRKVAARICGALCGVLVERGRAVLGVPGGRSVAGVFEAMRQERLDWGQVHVFLVDERLVPMDHPDSNFRLLREHLVDPLAREGRMPPQAHPFPGDAPDPQRAARDYDGALAELGSRFDVVLLSAGEDGHVASLFPDHHSLMDARHGFFVMDDAPKPPPGRMSASASLLRACGTGVLLFAGRAKAAAFARFTDPSASVSSCPAKLMLQMGNPFVFTDLT